MRILGIDPGAKTGWCVYDSVQGRVIGRGVVVEADLRTTECDIYFDECVIERPKGYGPTRPQLVDCGWVAGRLYEKIRAKSNSATHTMTRLDVCKALTEATHGEVRVRNDATAWAALKLLHGEGCDKKGGALHGVRSHERAALAIAVAFSLTKART